MGSAPPIVYTIELLKKLGRIMLAYFVFLNLAQTYSSGTE